VLINRPDNDTPPRPAVIAQLEKAQIRPSSVAVSRCVRPSPRSEFGRRRRPSSVVEATSKPPPPPPPRKPQLPAHVSSRTSDDVNPAADERLRQLTAVKTDGDFVLRDARQQNVARTSTSRFTPNCSSSPVDVTSSKCDHSVDSSLPKKTFVEPLSMDSPKSRYETSAVGPDDDSIQQSAVCTDVGSFAERLLRLKTHCERPQPDSVTFCTAAGKRSRPADVANSAVSPSKPCLYQQDSVFTRVPSVTTAPVGEVNVSATVSESPTTGNAASDVGDEVLFPPPPEFADSFTAPAPDCLAVTACDSDSVRDSGVDGWTVEEVCNWLDSVGLCEHCASFRMQNVDGAHLKTLGRSELIAIGLTDVHDRMKFERALLKMSN